MITYLFLVIGVTTLFLLLFVHHVKENKSRRLIGFLIIILSCVLGALYYYMQHFSGGVDQGQEITQMIFPLIAIAVFITIGFNFIKR